MLRVLGPLMCAAALFLSGCEQPKFGFTWTHTDDFVSASQGSTVTNIHVYGFGALWPFPGDGLPNECDDGTTIDRRVRRAVADGQEVMLTLATAPSNYRASGQAWNMEERVVEAMEDQYAARAADIVRRWPEARYVQIWNEFKGYWHPTENRWDYESYTRFYNKVYRAVKDVNPELIVGGGYMALRERGFGFDAVHNGVMVDRRDLTAMIYWMENAEGFDAVCLDGNFPATAYDELTDYFRALPQAKGKPIWWSEFYVSRGTMAEAAQNIADRMVAGDIALWWAEPEYLPYVQPKMPEFD